MSESTMTAAEKERLFELRCRCKSGGKLSAAEMKFCARLAKAFPDEYKALDRDVFNATRPFGAREL